MDTRLIIGNNCAVTCVPITPANSSEFIATRLRALQESPTAFGSTYAKESQFTEDDWKQRVSRWNGEKGIAHLAIESGMVCGIAGGYLNDRDPSRADLVSMWVSPTHRQRGIGKLLIDEVAAWARQKGATSLYLMVTSSNDIAMMFYQRQGFTKSGRIEPYPNDPTLREYEMFRQILGG
jgi:ribosomal protein S18 acetylase RimI-like enzyme